jgi:pimeloyl-ACP methyl ester carboxylesterase
MGVTGTTLLPMLLAAACGSPAGSPLAESQPAAEPSPAGQRVPFEVLVNGLEVRGHCVGTRDTGEPAVVLQAGNGGLPSDLGGVQGHMVDRTMVCGFARPGAGGNPAPADLPRPIDEVVRDVHSTLLAAQIEPPYFLVGQSAGSAVVFMFAQAYPDAVAGFVFINGNPPYETWRQAAAESGLPADLVAGAEADFSGENPERIDFRTNQSMLTDPLPDDLPYAVMYDECGDIPDCPINFEAAVFEQLAKVGEGGRFIWAKGAGHEMHLTEPQLVYDTIDEVWAEATD